MQQYFIKGEAKRNETISFDKEQSHHILHVMRMKDGDVVRIADAHEQMFFGRISAAGKQACAFLYEQIEDHTKLPVTITLLQGMIKRDKWDFMLQKTSELGVARIVPFLGRRSVIKAKEERIDHQLERWNRIVKEASEQCKRSSIPEVCAPISLSSMDPYLSELNIIAYEDADARSEYLGDVFMQHPRVKSITVVIGCEGGFDPDEVAMLTKKGCHRVSLGSRILRAETAAMYAVGTAGFFYEMTGGTTWKK